MAYNKEVTKLYGEEFEEKILEAVEFDLIDENNAKDIAYKLDGKVGGKFKQNKKEYGRMKFKEMLSNYISICSPKTRQEAREKMIKIFQHPDIGLNKLGDDLAALDDDTSTTPNGTSPSCPVQSGAAAMPQFVNFGNNHRNLVVNFGSNNQSTLNYEDKGTYYYLQDIERNHPEFHEAFVKKLSNTEKINKEKLLTSSLQNKNSGLPIPKVQTLLESVCLLKIPGGYIGTAFLAKVKGIEGVVLFSAGHNFYEKVESGCPDFPSGSCMNELGCSKHGFYSLESNYKKYFLLFNNVKGETTVKSDPPKQPQFSLQQLIDLFPNHKMVMANINIKREDKTGKQTSFTKPMNKDEDWFAMVMYDNCNGVTAEAKLKKVGLTSLFEVGSDLKQKPGIILSIFGYPRVDPIDPVDPCIPLRFHSGLEKNIANGSDDCIYYDMDTLGGNSGSPVLSWQDMDPNFFVKAIHVGGPMDKTKDWNAAQSLNNVIKDLRN